MMKRVKVLLLVCTIGAIGMISIYAFNRKVRDTLKSGRQTTQATDILREGDLIFQSSTAGQGLAIQLATHSPYTHIGMLFKDEGEWMVYEAVEPVQAVPLKTFTKRGDGKYVVKRLKGSDTLLTQMRLATMKSYAKGQINKHYDLYFGWEDQRFYCSELVWKCYNKIGVSIGPLKKLKEFDLSNPVVKTIMNDRYGKNIPYEEKVISPGDIFNNPSLADVLKN